MYTPQKNEETQQNKFTVLVRSNWDWGQGHSGVVGMVIDMEKLEVMPGVKVENDVVWWPVDAREFLALRPLATDKAMEWILLLVELITLFGMEEESICEEGRKEVNDMIISYCQKYICKQLRSENRILTNVKIWNKSGAPRAVRWSIFHFCPKDPSITTTSSSAIDISKFPHWWQMSCLNTISLPRTHQQPKYRNLVGVFWTSSNFDRCALLS